MGIDLATWRARIGLNYYHMCCPLQTRWRSSGGRLYQPGVAGWGAVEVINDTPLVFKGCMTVVALSLILQYVVHSWSKLKGRVGGSKVRCYWQGSTFQAKGTVDGRVTLLLRTIVVVLPLLLVIAGDMETNPGPEEPSLGTLLNELQPVCARWYNIGLQLNISHTKLDCFKQMYSDPSDLMREMLKYWLQTAINPCPTWKAVVTALRSRSVDEQSVAEQLESKYCISVQPVMHESNSPIKEKKSEGVEAHDHITDKIGLSLPDSARHNSNTNPPPSEGSQKTPFGCGCGKCTFLSFIEGGCPTPLPSTSSFSYLDLSVVNGHLEIVKFFIEKLKCPPDYLGMFNMTPLQLARSANRSDIAQYLQEHSVTDYIYTAIGTMMWLGYLTDDQFKYLTGFNLSLELKNCLSLILAAMEGNMNDVKFLTVEKHCDPMCREPIYKQTPLHVAALNGHIEIVKFLTVEMHCDLTSTDANHETVLHLTVAGGHLDILKFLISDQNCDPSITSDSNSRTLLHYAAGYGHLHIVQYLIDEQNCHQSCLDGFKCTPLHYATTNGHKSIVKFLTMEKHCDPMSRNSLGYTVLDHAALHGHLEIVKFLIEELKCPPDTLGPHHSNWL